MMFIFISLYGQKFLQKMGWVSENRLNSTSCQAFIVKLKKTFPAGQKTYCEGNNLSVEIPYPAEKKNKLKNKVLCSLLYRELANYLKSLAGSQTTPNHNLKRVDMIRLTLVHPQLTINAITKGSYLAKFSTINNPKLLADHLKTTVQVQETPSTCL